MPNLKGKGTYKGYRSPAPGEHSKGYADVLRKVYGSCRVYNPGESKEKKAKCARIAHAAAKRARGY